MCHRLADAGALLPKTGASPSVAIIVPGYFIMRSTSASEMAW